MLSLPRGWGPHWELTFAHWPPFLPKCTRVLPECTRPFSQSAQTHLLPMGEGKGRVRPLRRGPKCPSPLTRAPSLRRHLEDCDFTSWGSFVFPERLTVWKWSAPRGIWVALAASSFLVGVGVVLVLVRNSIFRRTENACRKRVPSPSCPFLWLPAERPTALQTLKSPTELESVDRFSGAVSTHRCFWPQRVTQLGNSYIFSNISSMFQHLLTTW